jgi:HK97 gp10 family phage protein
VIRVKVSGVPQYHAALSVLADEMESDAIPLAAAKPIEDMARRLAPVKSGALRRSIRTDRARGFVRVVAMARYSQFVHFGSIHNPRPVPFLYAARNAPGVQVAVEREVEAAMRKADL